MTKEIELQELRIGICGCTTRYHGKIGGQQVIIKRLGKEILVSPITLTLRETRIPEEDDHLEALQSTECHAFIDVEGEETSLDQVWFTGQQIFVGGRGRGRKEYWYRNSPPPPSIVLKGLKRLIERLPREEFEPWLELKPTPGLRIRR